jgi:hypothetical protein
MKISEKDGMRMTQEMSVTIVGHVLYVYNTEQHSVKRLKKIKTSEEKSVGRI